MPSGTIFRMALVGPLWLSVVMAAGAETTTADLQVAPGGNELSSNEPISVSGFVAVRTLGSGTNVS